MTKIVEKLKNKQTKNINTNTSVHVPTHVIMYAFR